MRKRRYMLLALLALTVPLPSLRRRDPAPPWTWSLFLAFTGVRGVVSLAAALAIPLTTAAGAACYRPAGPDRGG